MKQENKLKVLITFIIIVIITSTSLFLLYNEKSTDNIDENERNEAINNIDENDDVHYKINNGEIEIYDFYTQYNNDIQSWEFVFKAIKTGEISNYDDCYINFYDKNNNYLGFIYCYILNSITDNMNQYFIKIDFDGSLFDHFEFHKAD